MNKESKKRRQAKGVAMWLRIGIGEDDAVDELCERDWDEDDAYALVDLAEGELAKSDAKTRAGIRKRQRAAEASAEQLADGDHPDDVLDDLVSDGWSGANAQDILFGARFLSKAPGESQGEERLHERDLMRWHWGAFLLNITWGLVHEVYIVLLMLIPGVNVGVAFYLGLRGYHLAWHSRKWTSTEEFWDEQQRWSRAGWINLAVSVLIGLSAWWWLPLVAISAFHASAN